VTTGVQVRTFINAPRAMTGDLLVSAWVAGNDVNWTRNHFERFFSNDLRVVSFDHSGAFGQTVRVAARVDLQPRRYFLCDRIHAVILFHPPTGGILTFKGEILIMNHDNNCVCISFPFLPERG